MKTLQNNFTTPEQSKRLLELGVPSWTADMFRLREDTLPIVNAGYESYVELPCWSVGRLIEIYELLMGIPFTRYNLKISLLDEVLERYAQNIVCMNFSKLEE